MRIIIIGYWLDMEIYLRVLVRSNIARQYSIQCLVGGVARQLRYALRYNACMVSGVNSRMNECLNMN